MATMYDIKTEEVIKKAAEQLKQTENVQMPEWARFVKTGAGKERPPEEEWWHMRAASVLRKIYMFGPIGVSKLRTKYGNKKNRGSKPEKFYRGSGKIIRIILQQLEKEGLIKNVEKGVHKGKSITPKGMSFLDKAARLKDAA
ncbi:MAG: 30S ribosomal protein S19e [Candidatus Woesearchaeota archaeon]